MEMTKGNIADPWKKPNGVCSVGEGLGEEDEPGMTGLTALFHELNAQFFSGRFPTYRVTYAALPGPMQGKCLDDRRLIRLSRSLPPGQHRQVLLHEMCHIGIPGHGIQWRRRMRALAENGESWAAEEAEGYRVRAVTPSMIWGSIIDWIDEGIAGGKRMSVVRAACTHGAGLTPAEFRRSFPRFERTWKARKAVRARWAKERAKKL